MASQRFYIVLDLADVPDSDLLANDTQSIAQWLNSVMRPDSGAVDPTVYATFQDLARDIVERAGPFKTDCACPAGQCVCMGEPLTL